MRFPITALAVLALAHVASAKESVLVALANSDFGRDMPPLRAEELLEVVPGARDVTPQHDAVEGRGAAMFLLGGLDALKRPATWPEALAKDWDDGVAGCRAEAGGDTRDAARCSARLSSTLWQRFLDSTGADRFVLLSWRYLALTNDFELQAVTYRIADGPETRSPRKRTSAALAAATARQLVKDVLAGRGTKETRVIARALPGVPVPVPADARPADLAALALRGTCRLPPLAIAPGPDPLAAALARRWDRSIAKRTGGEPISCALAFPASQLVASGEAGPRRELHQVSLRCGELRVKASNVDAARYGEENQRALTEKLLTALADELCPR